MITVSTGALARSKKAMQKKLQNERSKLSDFKKRVKAKDRSQKDKNKIERIEGWLHRYRVSETLPVKVEGIVINYLPYDRLMKKLGHCKVTEKVEDQKLVIRYEVVYSNAGAVTNKMELYDLTPQLEDIADKLPEVTIKEAYHVR